ncbi:APC family permease [Lactiplantibacillus plantarum]|uniref:APC family permease n=1 Tax=Lactiplantibacillus plantarum TaxID=1590 RepID=UPI00264CD536|nr:amino acid permease [Lactiplantibacillus plantarum]MDN7014252.1 amino acid permease [Lactiplantibacillus plantarum]MDN7048229.1 amino acid permease [Lactiplantibacillus plantarum]MDN7051312.1 amino acid permease [Lactiplantibacillus plantarum]MDN7054315.1 amino acid permease [Lactiplantibacillus plantarum]MDN7057389.1 amino acid permease [Lactiplantibacillus plantarum]
MQETKQATTLNRSLGFWSALLLVVGTVIGSGIFFKQSSVLDSAGSPSAALLAWLLGGLITLTAGLTIAEVGAQMPHTGGLYVYMEQIYGKLWGFLSGWMQIAVYGPAIIASISAYLGILLVGFFNLRAGWQAPLSIGVIVLIGILNMFENRWGAAFQIATTLGKLLPIAAIIIFGLFYGNQNALGQSLHTITQSTGSFGVAVLATLFAYDGWILVANLGGEIKNPQKLLPQAIILGISMVLIAYTLVSYGILHFVPAATIHKLGQQTTLYFAQAAFGTIGGRLLNIGIIISMVGCLNGKIMTFPRIVYAMAAQNQLPFAKQLSYLHKKSHEPIAATIAILVYASIMILFFNPDRLSDLCIFTVYCFYVATFVGVFILRKRRPASERPFSTPGFPITPLIAILGALFVIISEIGSDLSGVLISLVIVAVGFPIYYWKQQQNQNA